MMKSVTKQLFLCALLILVIASFTLSSWYFEIIQSSKLSESNGHVLLVTKNTHFQNFQQPLRIQIYNNSVDKLPNPCIILRPLAGIGIGDQLYRYSFGYKMARKFNTNLFIGITQDDLTSVRNFTAVDRQFALDSFNLDSSIVKYLPESIMNEIPSKLTLKFGELDYMKYKVLPKFNRIILLSNSYYWQSHYYFGEFENELKEQLVLLHPTYSRDLIQEIELSESVSVHIRRGDFMGNGPHDRDIPISYQFRAIKLMTHLLRRTDNALKIKYFIFSDDIKWVEKTFQDPAENSDIQIVNIQFIYVSALNLTSLDEFDLMRQCKHNIIQNSGYSWWAAYLNKNPEKIVIAPFPRHRQKLYQKYGAEKSSTRKHKENMYWNHSYPDSWITINPYLSFQDSL